MSGNYFVRLRDCKSSLLREGMKMDSKEKTIIELLYKCAWEICIKYCKYYSDACKDLDELYKQYCRDCPLNRILTEVL